MTLLIQVGCGLLLPYLFGDLFPSLFFMVIAGVSLLVLCLIRPSCKKYSSLVFYILIVLGSVYIQLMKICFSSIIGLVLPGLLFGAMILGSPFGAEMGSLSMIPHNVEAGHHQGAAADENAPVAPILGGYPYPDDHYIGGECVLDIKRRLLSNIDFPTSEQHWLAHIDARDRFEVKALIIDKMSQLDLLGKWNEHGAKALTTNTTSTGERSLENLYISKFSISSLPGINEFSLISICR
uniref:DUF8018 domain-containing protein n=1 Tax=Beta vulgaris subsp. maritima TaxID=350892 RepID=F4MLC6_BETVM|nr:hypothetical protein [Beta vulgaris subsp. maritima]